MEEPQSVDQLLAHYAAVRARLNRAPSPPRVTHIEPAPAPAPVVPPKINKTFEIMAAIAAKYELTLGDITGKSRKNHVVNARHEAMWTLYDEHGRSLQFIARMFGGYNHTSVLHAVRRWRRIRKVRGE